MRIGVDIMGGDFAPEATMLGSIQARKNFTEDVELVLIGNEEKIREILKREGASPDDFTIVHTSQEVSMSDHPTKIFAKKPDSSIVVGFEMLKTGKLDCFASVGNTGAMQVGSLFTIRSIPGVIRPCITTILPKVNGGVGILLDVGANSDCKPDVLYQFAILGSIYAEHVYNISTPRVGLLNIGEEEGKGNLLTQATYELMKETTDFNFCGNVEARSLFDEEAPDVIVCDGFTGNVVLKEAEALYTLLRKRGMMDSYFERFNYEIYGGTPVLGVNSNVIIGHGISSPLAISNMLALSKDVVEAELPRKFKEAFNNE